MTAETEPVAPETVLIRTPFAELRMEELEMRMLETVLSVRPPTDPMDRPWPPEQVPAVNVMFCCKF